MATNECVVLVQNRKASEYNDFIGKFYHFPQKYKKMLSEKGLEFVYYEPVKTGSGSYFGYGKIGDVFPDKREKGHYFVEIKDYKPFASEVPAIGDDGKKREAGPGYNAQNTVRKICPDELEEICLDGCILLNFNADAHLIKVLGEELIASEVVGILELIKNSYDANASKCKIRIEKIPGLLELNNDEYLFSEYDGPVIVIEDDGGGMDRRTIEYGWLRPASTIKTVAKEILKNEREKASKRGTLAAYNTLVKDLKEKHGGRLPLGEKGVGRFATHRLGRKVIITTKVPENDYEYLLEIDWDMFDSHGDAVKDLSSVGISLKRQAVSRDYGERQSGTRIVIFGGRKGYDLSDKDIKDIHLSISKLKSPSKNIKKTIKNALPFDIVFECPQMRDVTDLTIEDLFEPVFTLDALITEDGHAEFTLKFVPADGVILPSETLEIKDYDLRKPNDDKPNFWKGSDGEKRLSRCGDFYMHTEVWYRSSPWIKGPDKSTFSDYLGTYGGISIYRDGLNIRPAEWGAKVDWLELSKRHIKKGEKLSYYNMIGQLEIEQSSNINLIDKTDRQGFIDNPAFKDLAELTRNLLFYVETQFKAKRDEFANLTKGLIREPKGIGIIAKQGAGLVDNIIKKYDFVRDEDHILELIYKDVDSREPHLINLRDSLKNLNKSMKAMQNVQDMLSEQAGYGLSIGVAVHEIAKITSNFYNGVSRILKHQKVDKGELKRLQESSSSLKTEIKRLSPIKAARNEPPAIFLISKAVKYCNALFESRCENLKIDFTISKSDDFKVFCRYGAAIQILSNLIDNSCYWLSSHQGKEKKILIDIDGQSRRILVADNGPDIDDAIRSHLFEMGYSLKVPPSGLGLYICQYYMRSMKGSIYEAYGKDRTLEMPGAQFILDFSKVPEDG